MLIDNTAELRFLELSGFLTHPPAKIQTKPDPPSPVNHCDFIPHFFKPLDNLNQFPFALEARIIFISSTANRVWRPILN